MKFSISTRKCYFLSSIFLPGRLEPYSHRGYLETELWSLLFAGESTEVLQAEIEKSGGLIRFMIAPSDAQVIDALVGKEITPELEPGNTIIVSGVYTK